MKWLTEIRASRCSLAEIGLLVVVRVVFKNNLEMSCADADETLGPGWATLARGLAKAGMLRVQHNGLWVRMCVVAPGDRKRERCNNTMRCKRAIKKLEDDWRKK